ncbi:cell wall hydrolase [Sphingomonas sp. CROZ-RG-20F-R02-07]|uniref:cell wall hydrolase n=1 Tax=Sphingomonas sp. CROZ-RG-20F-R02-07 TaxID=2914832 RepID=UPI001F5AC81B|nr:cell wall hydrolase [Sphingomonas sp. CROZ-RG-20F-R02-07]
MARRLRSVSNQGRRRRRRPHDRSAEHWLLLIGIVLVIAAVAGSIDPSRWWSRPAPSPVTAPPLTMAEARRSNAAVPIQAARRVQARPFAFHGGPAERAQAVDCLATAAIYEAGADPREQRAIIQVVLNRARTAGFPKTVCGVVYQGADRTTGCQFSFTCDGSLVRRPEHNGWAAARRAAKRALAGYVFADVGRATNYHADWMVPYWRGSLVKVARVRTHLFYVRRRASTD